MIRQTLSELFAFLRRPAPMEPSGLNAPGAMMRWLVLATFQIAVLCLVVMPVLFAWQKAFNLPSPDAFEGLGPLALWGGVVLLGPVLEECFFRGWMSGRLRALAVLVVVIVGLALFVPFGKGRPLVGGVILLVTVVAAIVAWFRLRSREGVPSWFVRWFPALVYGTTLVFALMHLVNYPKTTLLALPMVLPQFWSGLMFAHMRVRVGLPASILNHIASNAIVLTIALASG